MRLIITLLFLSLGAEVRALGVEYYYLPPPIALMKLSYSLFSDSSCDINNYFEKYKGTSEQVDFRCDLRGAYLRNVDLSNESLFFSSLDEVNLSYANLYKLTATGSTFFKADFTGADMREANFSFSHFHEATMTGANLYKLKAVSASFVRADFTGADMRETNLINADFRDANLTNANFTGAELREAGFYDANLTNAIFIDAKVDPRLGAYLTSQGVSGFIVVESEIRQVHPEQIQQEKIQYQPAPLQPASLQHTQLKGRSWFGVVEDKDESIENIRKE